MRQVVNRPVRDVAQQVYALLGEQYPDAACELDYRSPYELLVATVLSAQSTDRRVNAITPELFRRYPDPAALAAADRGTLEGLVRPTGLFRTKADSLLRMAADLIAKHDGRVPETLAELVKLPGVGRKTANVVLGNAFGIPGLTPDTHFMRVSARLGWTTESHPDKVEKDVAAIFDPADWVLLSHRLIWHGRRCCHSRRPACGACSLAGLCPSSDTGETDPGEAARLIREPRA